MAAYTSFTTGNWSAGGTWVGGVAPPTNAGHTVTIADTHTVTVDTNWTIGASLASPSTAIAVTGTTGKLIIGTGITLVVRGDIQLTNAQFQMNAGSVLEFDASAASSPASQHYVLGFATADYQNSGLVTITGTAGSRCTIRSNAGGGTGSLYSGFGTWRSFVTIRYTNFTNLGTGSIAAIEKGGSISTFDLENCIFDTCGEITLGNTQATALFRLVNVTMKNSVGSASINGDGSAIAISSGTRLIDKCVFDKLAQSAFRDYTITDTIISSAATGPIGTLGLTPWASFSGNLLIGTNDTPITGSVSNSYFLNRAATNPHYFQAEATLTVSGTVFEYENTPNNGDTMLFGAPGVPITVTLSHNIGLPGPAANTPGTIFSAGGTANVTIAAYHNTWYGGGQPCGAVGETYAGHTGLLSVFRDNLCWDDSATTYKLNDIASSVVDLVSSANCHHNAGYNFLAGSNLKGYNNLDFSSGSPGANDVDGTNPNFVDKTRNMANWDLSLGGPGTIAHALTELQKKNESGYNSAYNIADLIAWVKAGFVSQAAGMQAASDSVSPSNGWIGAMEGTTAGAAAAVDKSRLMLLGVGA